MPILSLPYSSSSDFRCDQCSEGDGNCGADGGGGSADGEGDASEAAVDVLRASPRLARFRFPAAVAVTV